MENNDTTAQDIGNEMKALVILSGGMDSTVCLAQAVEKYDSVETVSFNYGQTHSKEIQCAKKLAEYYKVKHSTIDLGNLTDYFKTSLGQNSDLEIPTESTDTIPNTYVPMRNTIMLSIATGIAESNDIDIVIYGANAVDYSGYPDCRPEYVLMYNEFLKKAITGKTIKVETPIINLKKSEIVSAGNNLLVPFELTWSCYRGDKYSCGKCPSCEYRLKGFHEAECVDPLVYG